MSKSKQKHAVRRDRNSKQTYSERLQQKKQGWTRNVYLFTQQETLDAASLALNEHFGFGPERLRRFAEAFIAKFTEIQKLNQEDRDDEDSVFSRQRFEDSMKAAWGPYYAPREVRYDMGFVIFENEPVIDQ